MIAYFEKLKKLSVSQILLIGFLLLVPSLFSGLFTDDWIHFAVFNGYPELGGGWPSLFGAFSFISQAPEHSAALINYGQLAWWMDESYSWVFFRPIAEISHYVDYVLLGSIPFVMHLQNLLLYLAVSWLLYICVREIYPEDLSKLVLLIFVFSNIQVLTVSWLANRSALLAAVFSLISFYFFIQSFKQQSMKSYGFSIIAFLFALLSGEIALSLGVFLFFYVCSLKKFDWKSILSLVPFFVIFCVWVFFYSYWNLGVKGEYGKYIDISTYPLEFLAALPDRLLPSFFSLFLPVPSDITAQVFGKSIWFKLIVIALALGLLFLSYRRGFFIRLGSLLAIMFLCFLPVLSHPPEDRNFIFVSMALALLIASLMQSIDRSSSKIASVMVFVFLFLAPLTQPVMAFVPKLMSPAYLKRAEVLAEAETENLLVFGGSGLAFAMPSMVYYLDDAPSMLMRISPVEPQHISIVSDNEILIYFQDSLYGSKSKERLEKLPFRKFALGEAIDINGYVFEARQIASNGAPNILSLSLPKSIDSYSFYQGKKLTVCSDCLKYK